MSAPQRVLVLGASGMLGSTVVPWLAAEGLAVTAAARRPLAVPEGVAVTPVADLTAPETAARLLAETAPDVVVNCAGLVKQRPAGNEPLAAIAANALLPHRLAALCGERGARLLHISTDCVFSGLPSGLRGPHGYRESDPTDPVDVYGRSKVLGEVSGPGCLTLRMSLIGREPAEPRSGLVEWLLAAPGPVRGYAGALFTGLTTAVAARLIALILQRHTTLDGVWHAAAAPISKLDLLRALAARARPDLVIEPVAEPVVDRRLDGTALSGRIGWQAPSWLAMLDDMLGLRPCGS